MSTEAAAALAVCVESLAIVHAGLKALPAGDPLTIGMSGAVVNLANTIERLSREDFTAKGPYQQGAGGDGLTSPRALSPIAQEIADAVESRFADRLTKALEAIALSHSK